MEAFERIESGTPGLDAALDSIRLGDNVVFQVSELEEYAFFVDGFVRRAVSEGRRLVYMRFAQHRELVADSDAARYTFDPEDGFESFTVAVHKVIEREGRGVFYVFDCLSELQAAWAADLMMGNFFCVTCPFLFRLDTVAFFPLMRGDHSFDTLARIRETTQLYFDVVSDEQRIYFHPLKVWNRYSPTMFMPHCSPKDKPLFTALTDAVGINRYYSAVSRFVARENQSLDNWERCFQRARLAGPEHERRICSQFRKMMMTDDPRISELFSRFFSREDYYRVKERMIGSGSIGGKACGMLLARSIIARELPQLTERMEPHDSHYIGDHVFYTFLVHNDLWELRIAQKSEEGYFRLADELAAGIRAGAFPENIRERFRLMLEYYGQSPIIVRSSSLLEDGFGNAFAGKYESVFCVNQGSPLERLMAFEDAVKTVYASTMSPCALEYRARRSLERRDEQMSVLVQRVSGSVVGSCFYPSAAGVGYSLDPYNWDRSINPKRGMLRMVCGLGTRAVDRTENDYPRIIHIDKPLHTSLVTADEKVRFSQHYADVLDLARNKITPVPMSRINAECSARFRDYVNERDYQTERRLSETGRVEPIYYANCRGFAENALFLRDMEDILRVLQREYAFPVDIEYTVNLADDGEYIICLLQCRPLQVLDDRGGIELPSAQDGRALFAASDSSMGVSQRKRIDAVALVDAEGYHNMPLRDKPEAARLVAAINDLYRDSPSTLMLISPGRVGTSSPELGVPVRYSGISAFSVIVEYDDAGCSFMPELSFGSHMFQDLVEAEIFYTALFSGGGRPAQFNRELLPRLAARLPLPDVGSRLEGVVSLYDTTQAGLCLYYDMMSSRAVCVFEPAEESGS